MQISCPRALAFKDFTCSYYVRIQATFTVYGKFVKGMPLYQLRRSYEHLSDVWRRIFSRTSDHGDSLCSLSFSWYIYHGKALHGWSFLYFSLTHNFEILLVVHSIVSCLWGYYLSTRHLTRHFLTLTTNMTFSYTKTKLWTILFEAWNVTFRSVSLSVCHFCRWAGFDPLVNFHRWHKSLTLLNIKFGIWHGIGTVLHFLLSPETFLTCYVLEGLLHLCLTHSIFRPSFETT